MKALSDIEFFGLSFLLLTILVLDSSLHSDAFGQINKKKYDMILLSQNFNSTGFADEVVGEILNNGTDTAKSVEISATFYDDRDNKVGYESTRTHPTTIHSGDTSMFTLQILNATIESVSDRYEFSIKWLDEDSLNYFAKLTGGEMPDSSGGDSNGDSNGEGEDGDEDDEDN
jgi:hypothetical protein